MGVGSRHCPLLSPLQPVFRLVAAALRPSPALGSASVRVAMGSSLCGAFLLLAPAVLAIGASHPSHFRGTALLGAVGSPFWLSLTPPAPWLDGRVLAESYGALSHYGRTPGFGLGRGCPPLGGSRQGGLTASGSAEHVPPRRHCYAASAFSTQGSGYACFSPLPCSSWEAWGAPQPSFVTRPGLTLRGLFFLRVPASPILYGILVHLETLCLGSRPAQLPAPRLLPAAGRLSATPHALGGLPAPLGAGSGSQALGEAHAPDTA